MVVKRKNGERILALLLGDNLGNNPNFSYVFACQTT